MLAVFFLIYNINISMLALIYHQTNISVPVKGRQEKAEVGTD